MSWLDISLIVFLSISILMGLWQGLIRSIFSMAGFVVGLWLAARFYRDLAAILSFIPQGSIAKAAAFILILIAVSIAAALLAWIIRSMVHAVMLGWVDHLGGAVFGFLLGAYFLSGILAFVERFSLFGLEEIVRNSALAQWLLSLPIISSLVASTTLPPLN